MKVRRNVGGVDRLLRVVVGGALLTLGIVLLASGCPCGWVNVVLGGLGLVTGVTGFCLIYLPFGFSTARTTQRTAG